MCESGPTYRCHASAFTNSCGGATSKYANNAGQSQTGYQTTTYTRYPYANNVCACRSHIVLAIVTGRGPGPDDPYYEPALRQTADRIRVGTLLADAGFDSERAHVFARTECGIRAIIPATRGRPTNPLRGYWRNKMKRHFPKRKYGQRWQIETVHSMIKRVLGATPDARPVLRVRQLPVEKVLTRRYASFDVRHA